MNPNKKFFRSTTITFFGIVAFSLLFWWWQPGFLIRPVQVLGQTVLKPFQQAASAGAYSSKSIFSFFASIHSLKEENTALEKERLRLLAENTRLAAFESENQELRKSLELFPKEKYSFIATEIIARDNSGQSNHVIINKGSNQGIREGMAVVVEAGVLIGKITEVFPTSARVSFIVSEGSVVNVETLNTQIKGVAEGEHGISVRLNMVEQGQKLASGDVLVTSGLGSNLPKGLLVGTIHDVALSEDRLFQQARIELPVKLEALHFLYLIR